MKNLLRGFFPPPLGARLWLTVAGMMVATANLALLREIWPYTPSARPVALAAMWLLALALLPQLAWWGWRWLRAYQGPGWVRLLATAFFLSGACLGLACWLGVLFGGPAFWLWYCSEAKR